MDIVKGCRAYELEVLVKNANLFSHMHILNNRQLLMLMQTGIMSTSASFNRSSANNYGPSIHRYSIKNICYGLPPLIDVVEIKPFSNTEKYIPDPITDCFARRKVSQLFAGYSAQHSKQGQVRTLIVNPLNQSHNQLQRLQYLTTKHPQIKQFHVNSQGDIMVLSVDGRAIYLRRTNNSYGQNQQYFINDLCEQKIQSLSFVKDQNMLLGQTFLFATKSRLFIRKFVKDQGRPLSIPLQGGNVLQIEASKLSKNNKNLLSDSNQIERYKVLLKYSTQVKVQILVLSQETKPQQTDKKIKRGNSLTKIKSNSSIPNVEHIEQLCFQTQYRKQYNSLNGESIQKVFFYPQKSQQDRIYFTTNRGIFLIEENFIEDQPGITKAQKRKSERLTATTYNIKLVTQLPSTLSRICHVSQEGNYLPLQISLFACQDQETMEVNCEKISLAGSTTNGVLFCLTTHHLNNYKDGRIIMFVPPAERLLHNCYLNIAKRRSAFQIPDSKCQDSDEQRQRSRDKKHSRHDQRANIDKVQKKLSKASRKKSVQQMSINNYPVCHQLIPLNFEDIHFLNNKQVRKTLIQLITALYKKFTQDLKTRAIKHADRNTHKITILSHQQNETTLTGKEFLVLVLNLCHQLEWKKQYKQKVFHQLISGYLESNACLLRSHSGESPTEIIMKRCIFSGKQIVQQEVCECKACNVYGIVAQLQSTQKVCPICWAQMINI